MAQPEKRDIVDDLETLVDADKLLGPIADEHPEGPVTFSDAERSTLEDAVDFFDSVLEAADHLGHTGTETVDDAQAARDSLQRLADNEGTVEDAETALPEIGAFGRGMQERLMKMLGA